MQSQQRQLTRRAERIAFDEEHIVSERRPSRKVRRLVAKSQLLAVAPVDVHHVYLTDAGRSAGEDDVAAIGRGIWRYERRGFVGRGNPTSLGVPVHIPLEQAMISLARRVKHQMLGLGHEPGLIAVQTPCRELPVRLSEPAQKQMRLARAHSSKEREAARRVRPGCGPMVRFVDEGQGKRFDKVLAQMCPPDGRRA